MRNTTRLSFVTLIVAVGLLAACSDVLQQATPPARLDLSLTGDLPGRIEDFELEITAPDMPTMTHRLGPRGSGSVTLEVPAGRNRRFSIFSLNDDDEYDVYAGETVASVAPGRETTVSVPVFPGPVIVDDENNRFVQVSDIGGRAQRVVTGDDIGEGLSISPVDAEYDDTGRLWVVDQFSPEDFAVTSFEALDGTPVSPDVATDVIYRNSALAVDSLNERVFVYGDIGDKSGPEWGVWEFDVQGQLITSGSPINEFIDELLFGSVAGLAVDPSGDYLCIIAATNLERTPVILKLEIESESVVRSVEFDSAHPGTGTPRWFGDVNVIGERVFVADAIDKRIFEYDLDLNHVRTYGAPPQDETRPEQGEFWGPRRFVATRPDEQIIVIDQQFNETGDSEILTGRGRVVGFRLDQPQSWRVLEDDSFEFFNANFS